MNRILCLTAVICFAGWSGARADYVWTAAGDQVSVYQEANWMDTDTGNPPPAGSIDPNKEVNQALIATFGTPGGSGGASGHLRLGTGSLSVSGDTVWRMAPGRGIRVDGSNAGNNFRPALVTDNAQLFAQFFSKITVSLGGHASISLYGGGNPINNSTIDFLSTTATLNMLAETPTDFVNEHLGKISVFGLPAVIGSDPGVAEMGDNLLIVADGANGSVVTAVPEPSILGLMGLAGLALCLRRLSRR